MKVEIGLVYSIAILVISLATLASLVYGNQVLPRLREVPPASGPFPKVSVVAAARNEAAKIEEAVRSLLRQDYPNFEVVVVNDRSEDETGEILRSLSAQFPKLQVVTIRDLPPGWLGKNHALWKGALGSGGDYILFTDGDVVMEPSTVSRAMTLVADRSADHLAVIPEVSFRSLWLRAFMGYFTMLFAGYYQPWKASDPKSKSFIGIGAFNLVKREAYLKMGTHERIRMRPDDDLKLGDRLKRSGARQECAFGRGMVRVEWYPSVRELVRGLEKNSYSGFEYRFEKAVFYTGMILAVSVFPFVAPFLLHGTAAAFSLAAALLLLIASIGNARVHNLRVGAGVLYPFAALLFVVIIWNAILKTVFRGGIEWRGTFYPLADLRRIAA
jgi:glycosyltransferase involved in cell wall biosynthesis